MTKPRALYDPSFNWDFTTNKQYICLSTRKMTNLLGGCEAKVKGTVCEVLRLDEGVGCGAHSELNC